MRYFNRISYFEGALLALTICGLFFVRTYSHTKAVAYSSVNEPTSSSNASLVNGSANESKSDYGELQQRSGEELRVLLFELRPYGFVPQEITVTPGKYLIVLENRSGKKGLTFRFDCESGPRLAESRAPRDWKARVTLAPGTYLLSEANESSWTSRIHVNNP
jgi:hypothetical protein